jgi:DNA polymerase III epsilon subunit-like protein
MPELFFDVETTGLPPRNAKPSDYDKFNGCRVVSIAWNLRDEKTVYSQKYAVSDPGSIEDGIVGAEHIHGITIDVIEKYGSPIEAVIHEFFDDVQKSDMIVAHNLEFDRKVVASELYRMGCKEAGDKFMNYRGICTMKTTTNLVKIKSTYGNSWKWPRLEELHVFLFGHAFENAHHAMCDVDALVKCYYRLVEKYNKKKCL